MTICLYNINLNVTVLIGNTIKLPLAIKYSAHNMNTDEPGIENYNRDTHCHNPPV